MFPVKMSILHAREIIIHNIHFSWFQLYVIWTSFLSFLSSSLLFFFPPSDYHRARNIIYWTKATAVSQGSGGREKKRNLNYWMTIAMEHIHTNQVQFVSLKFPSFLNHITKIVLLPVSKEINLRPPRGVEQLLRRSESRQSEVDIYIYYKWNRQYFLVLICFR